MPRNLNALILAEMVKEECAPIYLLEITVDESLTLRFADYDAEIIFPTSGENTYLPINFKFDSVKSTMEDEIGKLKVVIDNTDLFMGAYVENYNLSLCPVKLFCVYEGLLNSADYERIIKQGFMIPGKIDENGFEFDIIPETYFLEKELPNRKYNKYCPWTLDSDECLNGGSPLKDTVMGKADSGTYSTMADSARTEAIEYWNDGVITFTSGNNNGESRKVKNFSFGGNFVFQSSFPYEIETDDDYTLSRGCNKTDLCCKFRFNNFDNFGGFVSVPEEAT